jgi:hypothetical protein
MKAGRIGSLLDIQTVVDHADEIVGHGGNDRGAAWRAKDKGQIPVSGDDGWRHGGERTFAGSDEIGRTLNETELIGRVEPGSKVVHLVVQQEAKPSDGDAGAKTSVESVRA